MGTCGERKSSATFRVTRVFLENARRLQGHRHHTLEDPAAAFDVRLATSWRAPCAPCARGQAWLGTSFLQLEAGGDVGDVEPRAVDIRCVVVLQGAGGYNTSAASATSSQVLVVERWDGKAFKRVEKFSGVAAGEFTRLRIGAAATGQDLAGEKVGRHGQGAAATGLSGGGGCRAGGGVAAAGAGGGRRAAGEWRPQEPRDDPRWKRTGAPSAASGGSWRRPAVGGQRRAAWQRSAGGDTRDGGWWLGPAGDGEQRGAVCRRWPMAACATSPEDPVVVDFGRTAALLAAEGAPEDDAEERRQRFVDARFDAVRATARVFVEAWPAELTSDLETIAKFNAAFSEALRAAFATTMEQPVGNVFADGAELRLPLQGILVSWVCLGF